MECEAVDVDAINRELQVVDCCFRKSPLSYCSASVRDNESAADSTLIERLSIYLDKPIAKLYAVQVCASGEGLSCNLCQRR